MPQKIVRLQTRSVKYWKGQREASVLNERFLAVEITQAQ